MRRGFSALAAHDPDRLPVGGPIAGAVGGSATCGTRPRSPRCSRRCATTTPRPGPGTAAANAEPAGAPTLRGLLEIVPGDPVPLDEVEPWTEIVKRFSTGAMSFGSISAEAHETLALAMNRIGGRSNSGEGGEEARRFVPDADGGLRRSAIKQVASGRFGVTTRTTWSTPTSCRSRWPRAPSPARAGSSRAQGQRADRQGALVHARRHPDLARRPHHDIYSIEDLAQLIYDLQVVNPEARVSVKLVSEAGVGTVAAGVAKAKAGCVLISRRRRRHGRQPAVLDQAYRPALGAWPGRDPAGARPERPARPDPRADRRPVATARDVVVAALLGGEEFGFATARSLRWAASCCASATSTPAPVGIATQDPQLANASPASRNTSSTVPVPRRGQCGGSMAEARLSHHRRDGRARRSLESAGHRPLEGRGLDLSILSIAQPAATRTPLPAIRRTTGPDRPLDALDVGLIDEPGRPGRRSPLSLNARSTTGSCRRHHAQPSPAVHGMASGLPDDTGSPRLRGSAGQSFGASCPRHHLRLYGDANDYLGKGLSGGRVVYPAPEGVRFAPHENIIVGNTALYGATGGEVFRTGWPASALRSQQRRAGGGRGRRRSWLRVHDRRPWSWCSARPGATSPPA